MQLLDEAELFNEPSAAPEERHDQFILPNSCRAVNLRRAPSVFRQDLLAAVGHPPPGKHPLQEEDLQGRFHRHLQPRGAAHRVGAAGGECLV